MRHARCQAQAYIIDLNRIVRHVPKQNVTYDLIRKALPPVFVLLFHMALLCKTDQSLRMGCSDNSIAVIVCPASHQPAAPPVAAGANGAMAGIRTNVMHVN